jgi:sulfane dehydrogenase subunit SoxC
MSVEQGRVLRAPEGFLEPELVAQVRTHGVDDTRRRLLRHSLWAAASALATGQALARDSDPRITTPSQASTTPGRGVASAPYGMPSRHEVSLQRRMAQGLTKTRETSVSFTPLQSLWGIITPNGLHYERHHHGWHDLDPREHRLMLHGLVKTPKVYTLDDLMRLPTVSRMHFIECGANTATEWARPAMPTVQYTHGMLSCCEFTGVPLSVLLEDCGLDRARAQTVLAEGDDGASLTRTIAIERALDDVIVAWAMNGEMLRPENGYPLRLVVPGVQGVSWVKWLRRLKVGDAPFGTREESIHYIDTLPDGSSRQYTSIQECKSVITSPSAGQRLLGAGRYNITGLAWSGRGHITRVDVSVDGGRQWLPTRLEAPVLSKCLTRFNSDWVWHGQPCVLQSRAVDSTGHVQPSITALRALRGSGSVHHNNAIQSWHIDASGEVLNVQLG